MVSMKNPTVSFCFFWIGIWSTTSHYSIWCIHLSSLGTKSLFCYCIIFHLACTSNIMGIVSFPKISYMGTVLDSFIGPYNKIYSLFFKLNLTCTCNRKYFINYNIQAYRDTGYNYFHQTINLIYKGLQGNADCTA